MHVRVCIFLCSLCVYVGLTSVPATIGFPRSHTTSLESFTILYSQFNLDRDWRGEEGRQEERRWKGEGGRGREVICGGREERKRVMNVLTASSHPS